MFLTNFYALISSVEWLDFYTDSEGLSMSFISRSLLFLCNTSSRVLTKLVARRHNSNSNSPHHLSVWKPHVRNVDDSASLTACVLK